MDEDYDFCEDEDELKWLEKMNRSGRLNATGKRNLARARKIHARDD